MKTMDYYEIVKKLIGPIEPVGETHTDNKRFENLEKMTDLVEAIVDDLEYVRQDKDGGEWSIADAGKHADKCLRRISIDSEEIRQQIRKEYQDEVLEEVIELRKGSLTSKNGIEQIIKSVEP